MAEGKKPTGELDRRAFIRGVGAVTATAALAPAVAACGDDTGAGQGTDSDTGAAPEVGADTGAVSTLQPLRGDGSHPFHYIDTVVIVQMENRSFDHYFGSLSLLEGRTDIAGLTSDRTNRTADSRVVGIAPLPHEWVFDPDPPHGHSSSMRQWSNGGMDGFVREWEDELDESNYDERLGWVMGYHTRDQLPVHYGLADGFTLFDHWFCAMRGPTWPNRFFSHCATSAGVTGNRQTIDAPTPYPAMLDRGLRVASYHQTLVRFMLTLDSIRTVPYEDYELSDFFAHADAGTLPNVSIVEPDYAFNDDHPPQDIRYGQAFVGSIYEALRQSPHWDRCLMLVFYDEHGGFADHVPPPRVDGEPEGTSFSHMGMRVPGLMAGGLVRRGHVHSGVVEHSSVPRLISDIFEVGQVNTRAANAGDLGAALDIELTLDSVRPDAPELPTVELPVEKMFRSMDRPSGQPELAELCARLLNRPEYTLSQRRRIAEDHLRVAERLRVIRAI